MRILIVCLVVSLAVSLVAFSAVGSEGEAPEWSVDASYVDACCCAPTCPCLFGSSPTLGFCEGVSMVTFEKANYGDVKLDGVQVVAVYRGKTWIKFYVDESATAAQTAAAVELLPTFEEFFAIENVVEIKNVPITVEHLDDAIKIITPNTVSHIEVMRGKNGEPIKLMNLPAPSFPAPPFLDHTQYKTVLLKHESEEQAFEHEGTNGFTAKFAAVSSAEE